MTYPRFTPQGSNGAPRTLFFLGTTTGRVTQVGVEAVRHPEDTEKYTDR